jgi:hypothetical protein
MERLPTTIATTERPDVPLISTGTSLAWIRAKRTAAITVWPAQTAPRRFQRSFAKWLSVTSFGHRRTQAEAQHRPSVPVRRPSGATAAAAWTRALRDVRDRAVSDVAVDRTSALPTKAFAPAPTAARSQSPRVSTWLHRLCGSGPIGCFDD